jgi:hypothetical protein
MLAATVVEHYCPVQRLKQGEDPGDGVSLRRGQLKAVERLAVATQHDSEADDRVRVGAHAVRMSDAEGR